jgi:O-antigen ligase
MNLARLNKILEQFWWAMAIVSFVAVTYFSITEGWNKWAFYYIIPAIAALMALVRRFMKNKLEKSTPKNK